MAVFAAFRSLWEAVAAIALFGAVALTLGALWAVVKWWDDWRFKDEEG